MCNTVKCPAQKPYFEVHTENNIGNEDYSTCVMKMSSVTSSSFSFFFFTRLSRCRCAFSLANFNSRQRRRLSSLSNDSDNFEFLSSSSAVAVDASRKQACSVDILWEAPPSSSLFVFIAANNTFEAGLELGLARWTRTHLFLS